MKSLKMSFSLLLVCALLTGCWQAEAPIEDLTPVPTTEEQPESTPSRTILPEVFALPYAPDQTLDPISCPEGMQQTVVSLLYEGLFRLNEQLEPEPWLCESYTYAPASEEENTACTYTFLLRTDVTFSDGSPLTATDVKNTLNRAKNSERYGARLAQVRSISAEEYTLTITLDSSNTGFAALLDIPIVKSGTENSSVPLGTGPYLFSTTDTAAYLVANQTWWYNGNRPVDLIALAEAADHDTMLYRFTSHDVQLVTADLTGISPISATGNISFQDAHTTLFQYIGCNTTQAPLNNAAFRRVLWAGINRPHLVSAFLSGHAVATQFPVSPVTDLYPADLEERYSLESFTSALAACGYVADRPLTLLVNSENNFKVSVAGYLAEIYATAGIPVEVRALPWEEYIAALAAGDFDLYYGEAKLTADWNLSSLLAAGGSLNYGSWADPITDQLLSSFAVADDRTAAMRALCNHLRTVAPILPICFKSTSVLMQTDVLENLTSTMSEPFYGLTDCTIHLAS